MRRGLTRGSDLTLKPGLIFDCDGVLLNSNRLKQRAFLKTLEQFGFERKTIHRFSRFQTARFGLSRYRLFEELLSWDDPACSRVSHEELLLAFGTLMRLDYTAARTTPGLRSVLHSLRKQFRLFIVSGSDQAELRELLGQRDWGTYFDEVLGSPTSKSENIKTLLGLVKDIRMVAFIGDAEADFTAASAHGLRFIYMERFSTAKSRMAELRSLHAFPQITDLRELPRLVDTAGVNGSY